MADAAAPPPVLLCTKCGCGIDWCSFCDAEECAVACCYGCLVVDLAESSPTVHDHGG